MAWYTGTTSDYNDMLAKLVGHATANGWTALRNTSGEAILKSTTSSVDLFIGIKTYAATDSSAFGWFLNGYVGFNTALGWHEQPGTLTRYCPAVPMLNSTMTYWLSVTSRRITGVVRSGTVYHGFYLGFILPYRFPNQHPYPLVIGGSDGSDYLSNVSSSNYRRPNVGSTTARMFWHPIFFTDANAVLWVRDGSTWQSIDWFTEIDSSPAGVAPYNTPSTFADVVGLSFSGDYPLMRAEIFKTSTQRIYGSFDGWLWISGLGQTAESTFSIGTDQYIVFPNVFRVGTNDFAALRMA